MPAYELPDPLDLRVEVNEETGAKTHDTFVRKAFQSYLLKSSCRIDIRSLTPAQLYELNQVWFHFV
jgi:hypothetical protein